MDACGQSSGQARFSASRCAASSCREAALKRPDRTRIAGEYTRHGAWWWSPHEISLSEAVVPEALDYVVHFCGLDCYERWRLQIGAA